MGTPAHIRAHELPDGFDASVAKVGDKVQIRLDSRKNALEGDTISRPCLCKYPQRAWRSLCPVHRLFARVSEREVGEKLYHAQYNEVLHELKRVALKECGSLPAPVGTHSIRRSAIQNMEASGPEQFSALGLLGIGNHNSRAVNEYRDLKSAEERVFRMAVLAVELEDSDEEE
jgi:hypothetical protein